MKNSYPQLQIDLTRIAYNSRKMVEECQKRGLQLVAVEKLTAGNIEIAETLIKSGVTIIGDSRIANLKKLKNLPVKKMLLRIPMLSEIEETVHYSDICLISEILTIEEINHWVKHKPYEIILMIETGDIREGLLDEKIIFQTVEKILTLSNISLLGLGTNFACYGGTLPTVEKLQSLVALKVKLETKFKIKLPIISAGNSSHISIWDDKNMPKEVNQVRCGASIMMGIGLSDLAIPFLNQNNFKLVTEIIEIQDKPSASWGKRGALDAFGKEFTLPDIGIRKKAIVAIGRQDVSFDSLIPVDSNIKILGGSSDHTILDITDSKESYQIGDFIDFDLDYAGVLSTITSEYVSKKIINDKEKLLKND